MLVPRNPARRRRIPPYPTEPQDTAPRGT